MNRIILNETSYFGAGCRKMLAVAAFNDVCTGGNPRPTSVPEIEALYRKAF